LNHQLSIQGFPSYINLKGLKKEDATHIIECIFALIQQHQVNFISFFFFFFFFFNLIIKYINFCKNNNILINIYTER